MNEKKLSRRQFLKSSAAMAGMTALSMSLAPMANAANAEEKENEIQWDKECEVLVVGTGTVITAAIAASEFGAKSVIVLEKSPNFFGGTSAISGGGYSLPGIVDDIAAEGVQDTREDVLAYMQAVGEGRMPDEMQIAFVDNANEYVEWAKATFGWTKFGHWNRAYGDYYEHYDKSIADGFGRGSCAPYNADGELVNASVQWTRYREYVDSHDNIELLMGTPATALITDDNGAVIGVYAEQDGKKIAIKAEKGVILGTGGFDHNEKMRKYYLPYPIYGSCAVAGNTGDAQNMGAKIGARLAFMDRYMGVPFWYTGTEWGENDDRNYELLQGMTANADWSVFINFPHSMVVNRKGKRFGNESRFYDTICRSFSAYDNGIMKYENIPAFWICDSVYAENFLLPGHGTPDALPEFITVADTLEELAEKMGIDKENLLAEVEKFNGFAKAGVDTEWHRGESSAAVETAKASSYAFLKPETAELLQKNSDVLGSIEQGPFYCVRYVPGSCNTRGGLLIDGHAQVYDVEGELIPGLFATGTCSTGVAGYWAGGSCISQGSIMSYLAARYLVKGE